MASVYEECGVSTEKGIALASFPSNMQVGGGKARFPESQILSLLRLHPSLASHPQHRRLDTAMGDFFQITLVYTPSQQFTEPFLLEDKLALTTTRVQERFLEHT